MSTDGTQSKRSKPSLNQLQIERLALGELPAGAEAELRSSVGEGPLEAHLRALEADNVDVLDRFPTEQIVPSISRRVAAARELPDNTTRRRIGRQLGRPLPVVGMAAAALVTLALLLWTGVFSSSSGGFDYLSLAEEVTRIKGIGSHVRLYRQHGTNPNGTEAVERLEDGDIASAGDVVQLGYVAAGHRYGVIISIDGAGAVTLHAPDGADASSQLEQSGEVLLQHAFQLDDAPHFERFFFVTSDTPVSPLDVLHSASSLARDPVSAVEQPLELRDGWEQFSLTLWKD